MPSLKLHGEVAIVTGGGSGIGRATCLLFAKEGANVIVVDINAAAMDETFHMLPQNHGNRHCAMKCDISNAEEVDFLFERAKDAYEKESSVLVNCAGLDLNSALVDEIKLDDFEKVIDVNLKGTVLMSRGFIKAFKDSGSDATGAIVNLGSINGKIGVPGSAAYCASKSAVTGITKTVASEFPMHRVRCNAIRPSFVDTPLYRKLKNVDHIIESIPLKRVARPEEIASVCLFLVSDDSSYINGAILDVTGGMLA